MKPDWAFWLQMRQVQYWEAVALSLDIEPDEFKKPDFNPIFIGFSGPWIRPDSFPSEEIRHEFDKRLRLMKSNARSLSEYVNDWVNGVATLRECARWFSSVGKQIPSQLMGLLNSQSVHTPASAVEQNDAEEDVAENKQRQRAQETLIIEELIKHGYSPKHLRRDKPGQRGIKSEIRSALSTEPLFSGSSTFKKAWERLRGFGEIAENV